MARGVLIGRKIVAVMPPATVIHLKLDVRDAFEVTLRRPSEHIRAALVGSRAAGGRVAQRLLLCECVFRNVLLFAQCCNSAKDEGSSITAGQFTAGWMELAPGSPVCGSWRN